jgi:hypothetical protein
MVPPSLLPKNNNDAGDLNKKDVLSIIPTAEIPRRKKTQL